MTEHDIQSSIRLALSERGYFAERINVGQGYLINKTMMDKIKACCPQLRAELNKIPYFKTGSVLGRSDLSAIRDGKISFIEVKKPGCHIRPDQTLFLKVMRERYGCAGGIAYSVEDALKICGEV